jgi:hypothetical protein
VSGQLTDLTQRKVGVIVFAGAFVGELVQQVRASPTPIVLITPLPYRLLCPSLRRRPGHSRSCHPDASLRYSATSPCIVATLATAGMESPFGWHASGPI